MSEFLSKIGRDKIQRRKQVTRPAYSQLQMEFTKQCPLVWPVLDEDQGPGGEVVTNHA